MRVAVGARLGEVLPKARNTRTVRVRTAAAAVSWAVRQVVRAVAGSSQATIQGAVWSSGLVGWQRLRAKPRGRQPDVWRWRHRRRRKLEQRSHHSHLQQEEEIQRVAVHL